MMLHFEGLHQLELGLEKYCLCLATWNVSFGMCEFMREAAWTIFCVFLLPHVSLCDFVGTVIFPCFFGLSNRLTRHVFSAAFEVVIHTCNCCI